MQGYGISLQVEPSAKMHDAKTIQLDTMSMSQLPAL
jgi:hypothetical protein